MRNSEDMKQCHWLGNKCGCYENDVADIVIFFNEGFLNHLKI